MKKKTLIYLCDLVHDYIGAATYMFPLNVGYLAANVIHDFNDEVEIKIFKFPKEILRALKERTPDVLGFANYIWNANLNSKIAEFARSKSSETLIVYGGPHIDYTDDGIRSFFNKNRAANVYIPYQGETPFNNLIAKYFDHNRNLKSLLNTELDGTFTLDDQSGQVRRGKTLERLKDPDVIDSPYLSGLLDEFFDTNLIPIIETNRGCPYRCTFCAQGLSSFNKINYFTLDRVREEIKYVSNKVKNTNLLHFADSNFGIVDRDIEITEFIAELRKTNKNGYPRKVSSNMAKNRPPEKMLKIAEILGETSIIVSLQSLDDTVLERIKRKNIKLENFKQMIEKVNHLGGISGTEIILGLPGETKESHMRTLAQLFDLNATYIIAYNGLVLLGTELFDEKMSGEFKCKTKFRLIDSSFGEYENPLPQAHNVSGEYPGGIIAFEVEEGILETDTLSQNDLLFFRPVHWLIQFMWNYKFYFDLLKFVQLNEINPLDFVIRMIEMSESTQIEKVRKVFQEFKEEARNEWFDSEEELIKFYSKPENLKNLKDGLQGKMNGKYIFKVLVELKTEFEDYLLEVVETFPVLQKQGAVIKEIIRLLSESILDLKVKPEEIPKSKSIELNFNLLEWRSNKFNLDSLYFSDNANSYNFELSDETVNSLRKLITQYSHNNINVTLRKMSEYMPIKDFYYRVEDSNKAMKGNLISTENIIENQVDRMGVAQ